MTSEIVPKALDEGRLGPAMKALPSNRQRAFVLACVEPTPSGEVNYTAAARIAGYSGDATVVKVTAHRLAHDERVQAAIVEEASKFLGGSVALASKTLIQIMTSSTKEANRLKAAAMILNRTGLPEKTQHEVKVTHEATMDEKIARAIQLAKDNGLDPKKLLGNIGIVLDGDFKVVEPDVDLDAFLA